MPPRPRSDNLEWANALSGVQRGSIEAKPMDVCDRPVRARVELPRIDGLLLEFDSPAFEFGEDFWGSFQLRQWLELRNNVSPVEFARLPDDDPLDIHPVLPLLRRFEQEAKALAALAHPNILVVHDVGTHDGRPYLVSEFLAGKTLCDYIAGTLLGLKKVLDFGVQITEGLGAAHVQGIIHRDLKPANIFVTEAGQLKLLDFGLSKLLHAEALSTAVTVRDQDLLTSPGTVMGTVAYMSPEQALGQELDARSDLFSLGVVLYEMSTGKRLFEGATSGGRVQFDFESRAGTAVAVQSKTARTF